MADDQGDRVVGHLKSVAVHELGVSLEDVDHAPGEGVALVGEVADVAAALLVVDQLDVDGADVEAGVLLVAGQRLQLDHPLREAARGEEEEEDKAGVNLRHDFRFGTRLHAIRPAL